LHFHLLSREAVFGFGILDKFRVRGQIVLLERADIFLHPLDGGFELIYRPRRGGGKTGAGELHFSKRVAAGAGG
jgi:hypothetical protein